MCPTLSVLPERDRTSIGHQREFPSPRVRVQSQAELEYWAQVRPTPHIPLFADDIQSAPRGHYPSNQVKVKKEAGLEKQSLPLIPRESLGLATASSYWPLKLGVRLFEQKSCCSDTGPEGSGESGHVYRLLRSPHICVWNVRAFPGCLTRAVLV